MKILTTTLCYPTPANPEQGIFVQRRARALAERHNVDVQVVAPRLWCPVLRRGGFIEDQQEPLPTSYPPMVSVPVLGWATDGLAYAHAIQQAVNKNNVGGIDLIDAHFVYPDGVGAWIAGRRLGIPVVVTVRGKIVSLSRRAIRRWQIAAMLRGVDGRIAVSKSLARWVYDVAGADLQVDVIPNGVDEKTHYPIGRDKARASLGWDAKARYLLAVGHLQRVKGFDRLLSVLPGIWARAGDVRLVLAGSRRGERSFKRQVEKLIAMCGGSPAVTFTGPTTSETLNRMYNAADVMVCPSRSEGWSNAIAESLAAGTPVVATDVGGNREQVCADDFGMVVTDGDEHALTEAIINALNREWDREVIGRYGTRRGWGEVAQEVYGVFRRVLAGRGSVAAVESAGRLPGQVAKVHR